MTSKMKSAAVLVSMLGILVTVAAIAQQGAKKLPPDYEKKREAIRNFEAGVVPLFALGDLNEDGAVDQKDLALLQAYVTRKGAAGISCLAAGDLDDNGSINANDIAVMEKILGKGAVRAPALSSHARAGCDYKNFFIAARPQAKAGGAVPIHFLDAKFNAQNATASVVAGQAKVVKQKDGFVVQVDKSAAASSVVTVSLALDSAHSYFYTFPVQP